MISFPQIIQICAIIIFLLLAKHYLLPYRSRHRKLTSLKKVLIVDDDPDIIKLVSQILIKEGVEVIATQNSLQALETLKQNQDIDLLITDIYMPEMNGLELSQYAHDKIPVLVISSASSNQHFDHVFRYSDLRINKDDLSKTLILRATQAVINWKLLRSKRAA